MSCKSCKTTIKKVFTLAQKLGNGISELSSQHSELMELIGEFECREEEELNSIEIPPHDENKDQNEGQNVIEDSTHHPPHEEKEEEPHEEKEEEEKAQFSCGDIREKSQVEEEDDYKEMWKSAIIKDREKYMKDLSAKSIRDVRVKFFEDANGNIIGNTKVEGRSVKDLPAVEDQVMLSCQDFSLKAKVIHVGGFKEITITFLIMTKTEMPSETVFDLSYIAILVNYKRMHEAISTFDNEMEDMVNGQFHSEKR